MNAFIPHPFEHVFHDESVIVSAENELAKMAARQAQGSWGYFPHDIPDVHGLTASVAFVNANSHLTIADRNLPFSWLRVAVQKQTALQPLHLDGDPGAGFTRTIDPSRRIWRAVMNLSTQHERVFGFSLTDPWSRSMKLDHGYFYLEDEDPEMVQKVVIPPREGRLAHGLLVCVSQLLHTGIDDEHGHFLVSYAADEA